MPKTKDCGVIMSKTLADVREKLIDELNKLPDELTVTPEFFVRLLATKEAICEAEEIYNKFSQDLFKSYNLIDMGNILQSIDSELFSNSNDFLIFLTYYFSPHYSTSDVEYYLKGILRTKVKHNEKVDKLIESTKMLTRERIKCLIVETNEKFRNDMRNCLE